ncbi:MAG: trypsin-like peptidase domain-containing protein [Myxococcota bacterium]
MRRGASSLVVLALALAASPAVEAGPPRTPVGRGPLLGDEQILVDAFARASPAVVYVSMRWRFSGGAPASKGVISVGSGIVWDKDGIVVTNHHVVTEKGGVPWVTFADGTDVKATLIADAPEHDIAIIKVDVPAEKLTPIELGTSADLRVGQTVMAIGNPFGLDHTLTVGIVSAVDREMRRRDGTLFGLIQTDAAINPGNSGGPLLDSAGRLVGINTAIASDTGTSIGVGFAIPVDNVIRIVTRLGEHPIVSDTPVQLSGYAFGIVLGSQTLSARFKFTGIAVRSVEPGSPAANAGIIGVDYANGQAIPGDAIISINGLRVLTQDELTHAVDQLAAGQTATLLVERAGARREVALVVTTRRAAP